MASYFHHTGTLNIHPWNWDCARATEHQFIELQQLAIGSLSLSHSQTWFLALSLSCSQSFSIPISQLPFLGVYPFLSTYRGLELWRSEIILSAGNTNSHFAICAAKNESFFARNRLKAFLLLLLLAPRLSPADIIPMDIFRTNGLLKFISEVVTLTVF